MNRFGERKGLLRASACILALHLIAVVAMAGSPQLHSLFHHDADHHDHECAVTVMISGGSDGAIPAPILSHDFNLPASHASLIEYSYEASALCLSARIFEHAPPTFA
jgi:hypothetical protein